MPCMKYGLLLQCPWSLKPPHIPAATATGSPQFPHEHSPVGAVAAVANFQLWPVCHIITLRPVELAPYKKSDARRGGTCL